ncbi:hypothetical protein C8R46DRAFT_1095538 [Mycena filopes]|nr:hypothetical protein C8R46DRAFT_1095538 [Mycena filopes]
MSFLSILAESAALQTMWVIFGALMEAAHSDVVFIVIDTFPAIIHCIPHLIGISNTLIHARVGLGWSQSSDSMGKPPPPPQSNGRDAVCRARLSGKHNYYNPGNPFPTRYFGPTLVSTR